MTLKNENSSIWAKGGKSLIEPMRMTLSMLRGDNKRRPAVARRNNQLICQERLQDKPQSETLNAKM